MSKGRYKVGGIRYKVEGIGKDARSATCSPKSLQPSTFYLKRARNERP